VPDLPLRDDRWGKLVEALAEVSGVGGGDDPDNVTGAKDRKGNLKRLVADYPNGWQLRVNLAPNRDVRSWSAKIKFSTRKPTQKIGPVRPMERVQAS
jgi:hypothetical protein